MHYLQLSPISFTAGITAVFIFGLVRVHFAFRYKYLCVLFRRRPGVVKWLLQRSYLKNRTIGGLLDKSTKEILDGEYDNAERYIIEGIHRAKEKRSIQGNLAGRFFYRNLSWNLYYKGHYKESLQIAISVYEKTPPTPDILALISCNFARLGDVQCAVEAMTKLSKMRKARSSMLLPCKAEIEAAKGNSAKALDLLGEVKRIQTKVSVHFASKEIEKRIIQLRDPMNEKQGC